jgi:hypothetical protein
MRVMEDPCVHCKTGPNCAQVINSKQVNRWKERGTEEGRVMDAEAEGIWWERGRVGGRGGEKAEREGEGRLIECSLKSHNIPSIPTSTHLFPLFLILMYQTGRPRIYVGCYQMNKVLMYHESKMKNGGSNKMQGKLKMHVFLSLSLSSHYPLLLPLSLRSSMLMKESKCSPISKVV